ncbi:hypothetical protein F444_20538 [Phytophthora nicotianae P1976]|uniref:Uncharacterized protein n=1 Tax=Phytophthora nicotianae P1976 TaxID=1317066 RepID=A0A080Z489_PHYNI|nr:hypothetical protein F444_20538 [Phytophthora nicotianae P1976]
MDAGLLFHHFTKPMEWLIPLRDPVPQPGEWRDDLVDESNVRESASWEIRAAPMDPLTFNGRGWFRDMMRLYALTRMSNFGLIGTLPTPFRGGGRWKPFLQQVLIGLLLGYCDLDLLLDPFFLHFPRPGEAGAWYPGIEDRSDPADLLETLAITDAADRWRNHYRDGPKDHPALGIARLSGKFVSSSSCR